MILKPLKSDFLCVLGIYSFY